MSLSFTGFWPVHHAYALLRRPFPSGASSAVTAAKTKKGHPDGRPFLVFGGGGGSLSFTGLWPVHHAYAMLRRPFPSGAGSAVTAAENKKGPPSGDPFLFLVEAAGVEPASASTLPLALHA